MTKNWVSQVVSSLGCIYNKKINRTEFGIEHEWLRVATVVIISLNIADFSDMIFGPKLC